MAELAQAGDFCPNPTCSDYEELGGKIIRHGRTRAGVQRFKCLSCGRITDQQREQGERA